MGPDGTHRVVTVVPADQRATLAAYGHAVARSIDTGNTDRLDCLAGPRIANVELVSDLAVVEAAARAEGN